MPTPTPSISGRSLTVRSSQDGLRADGRYVVKRGDSLYSIAQRFLGEGKRWPELQAANQDILNGSRVLMPGMALALPKAPTPAPAPRPEGDRLERSPAAPAAPAAVAPAPVAAAPAPVAAAPAPVAAAPAPVAAAPAPVAANPAPVAAAPVAPAPARPAPTRPAPKPTWLAQLVLAAASLVGRIFPKAEQPAPAPVRPAPAPVAPALPPRAVAPAPAAPAAPAVEAPRAVAPVAPVAPKPEAPKPAPVVPAPKPVAPKPPAEGKGDRDRDGVADRFDRKPDDAKDKGWNEAASQAYAAFVQRHARQLEAQGVEVDCADFAAKLLADFCKETGLPNPMAGVGTWHEYTPKRNGGLPNVEGLNLVLSQVGADGLAKRFTRDVNDANGNGVAGFDKATGQVDLGDLRPGDVLFYDWDQDGVVNHTMKVIEVHADGGVTLAWGTYNNLDQDKPLAWQNLDLQRVAVMKIEVGTEEHDKFFGEGAAVWGVRRFSPFADQQAPFPVVS